MKNNNISNRSAPTIMVRVEDFLVQYKYSTIWDKVVNFVSGIDKRATLNEDVVDLLYFIFRRTDFTVDLVIEKGKLTDHLAGLLSALPYGRIIEIERPVQVAVKLNSGSYLYYVDDDLERLSKIGHRRCTTLSQVMPHLMGGYVHE